MSAAECSDQRTDEPKTPLDDVLRDAVILRKHLSWQISPQPEKRLSQFRSDDLCVVSAACARSHGQIRNSRANLAALLTAAE